MDALVIGKPNVGKSLFVLNFASYLGLREIRLDVMSSDDRVSVRRVSLEDAKRKLVSHTAHKTLLPRRVDLVSLLGSLMTRAPSPNGSVHITVKPVDRMRPSGSRRIGGIPLPREHVVAIVLCAVSTFDPLCRGLRPLSMGNDAIHAGRVQRANHQRYPKHGRVLFFEPCCTGLAIG
ncbi:hypothetical protein [Sulfobacillus thermotolerans]|uniref:hypothetical protein n=1 Tax=Sulfobacillus thermotolerans TaxID=338644 RepID=UPI003365C1FF